MSNPADFNANRGTAPFFAWPTSTAPVGEAGEDRPEPALSVVAPMFNEEGGAKILIEEISAALGSVNHEIVIVDDCSDDGTRAALMDAKKAHPQLRVIAHGANAGQSRSLRSGVLAARAPVIAMLDGDGQNHPDDISALYAALTRTDAPHNLAMVAGERQARQDTRAKKIASRFANKIRAGLLNDNAADTGCGLKVFYREAFIRMPYFDHMHRYLPALMVRERFAVEFRPVRHRARAHGASKYTNLGRLAVAFRDMLGVMWLNDRSRSPIDISEL